MKLYILLRLRTIYFDNTQLYSRTYENAPIMFVCVRVVSINGRKEKKKEVEETENKPQLNVTSKLIYCWARR